MDKVDISLLLSKLEDLRGEIKGIRDEVRSFEAKLREGYFIYTFETSEIENLLKKYSIRYVKKESVVGDLYEYILNCQEHQFKEIQDRINSTGVKAIATTKRLFNVVVAQEKKKIVEVDASQTGTVAAGSSEVVTITPPSGKIYKIYSASFYVPAPDGASSGNHKIDVFLNDVSSAKQLFSNTTTYSSGIYIFRESNDVFQGLLGVILSEEIPLVIRYFNLTDVAQDHDREITVYVEELEEK